MDKDTRTKFAALLRAAATRTVPEEDFWEQFKALADPFGDPIAGIAHETATHYWGNFHSKNILFISVKPDKYQVMQGQNELNLIADGLEGDWSVSDLKRRLQDI
jgi:hypothetical protein